MSAYNIVRENDTLRLAFGAPAQNDEIVRCVETRLAEMVSNGDLPGGKLIKLNGPASLPVACAIAHKLTHLYGALGVFDPKLAKYVVAVSHDPDYKVGDLID